MIPVALRELLSNSVDYAGLFPPASLDLSVAVANYARYRESPDSWMLGNFVVPAAKVHQLVALKSHLSDSGAEGGWPLAVLLGASPVEDLAIATHLTPSERCEVALEAVEVKLGDAASIDRLAARCPTDCRLIVEVPIERDPTVLIAAIGRVGAVAKARTGGVTSDAFPSTTDVLRFIRGCVESRVPFKLTAGLHHPLRGDYALTYAAGAPRGTMFGYLNVFLAAGFVLAGMADADLARLLEERDAGAVVADGDGVIWRGHRLDRARLRDLRSLLTGFGSCSFTEPVEELDGLFA